ncbi:MAG TPA: glycosyltransferase [Candidatus Saccharimonadales bacterium]|nr:glycosyltransferase [Candidatus Saccharimonadales bacterium]
MKLNKNSTKILFATFSPWIKGVRLPTNGSLEPLREYFLPKVKTLVLIDQPIPGSDFVLPRNELYKNEKFEGIVPCAWYVSWLYGILWKNNTLGTRISFKIRDFLSVINMGFVFRPYDVFIGLESINAMAGIVLKKFGLVKRVVYYVSDYSPNRYSQGWFNSLYLWLDRFACYHSDYIWDVSTAMQPQRIKAGLKEGKSSPVIHVPNGLFEDQILSNSPKDTIANTIAYMGTLGKENGVDILIQAMPLVLKKLPTAKLHIIGGGKDDLERLKALTVKLKLDKQIIFYGFVQKSADMARILGTARVAVIPYLAIPGSARWYADANKIRAYAAANLPIVTTHVPPLGQEAAKQGAAIIVQDNSQEIAEAVIKVLTDEKVYSRMRKAAGKFAKNSTWENTFNQAFSQMK